jgi:hypothetical protein
MTYTTNSPKTRKLVTSTGAAMIRAIVTQAPKRTSDSVRETFHGEALRVTARVGYRGDSHEVVGRSLLDRLADLR